MGMGEVTITGFKYELQLSSRAARFYRFTDRAERQIDDRARSCNSSAVSLSLAGYEAGADNHFSASFYILRSHTLGLI